MEPLVSVKDVDRCVSYLKSRRKSPGVGECLPSDEVLDKAKELAFRLAAGSQPDLAAIGEVVKELGNAAGCIPKEKGVFWQEDETMLTDLFSKATLCGGSLKCLNEDYMNSQMVYYSLWVIMVAIGARLFFRNCSEDFHKAFG